MTVMSYLGAIGAAQREAMQADERVVIIGEDVEANVYGTTGGSGKSRAASGDFLEMFGANRIRNTPISEEVIVGACAGAAMTGLRPIVDLSYSSFLYMAMDQFVNQVAKNRYMFGGQASMPVVFRSAMFYGLNTGAHHSDRPYPMFMNVPGLKVVVPASPRDAKGLLRTAVDSDDPVLIFEACMLWGTKEDVPEEEYHTPFGVARTVREGSDVTIVAISSAVPEAVKAADELAEQGISAEVLDPRTLVPLDVEAIVSSVQHRTAGRRRPGPPHVQRRRGDLGHRGRGGVLVAHRADRAGDHAGHADPVQPGAGEAALPQPLLDRRRGAPGHRRGLRHPRGHRDQRSPLDPTGRKETAMARVEVLLPQWGMGMSEGTVLTWHKAVGDSVTEDEPLAEVEAEKVEETLESPATGTLSEILVNEGDTVEVRTVVAVIETS